MPFGTRATTQLPEEKSDSSRKSQKSFGDHRFGDNQHSQDMKDEDEDDDEGYPLTIGSPGSDDDDVDEGEVVLRQGEFDPSSGISAEDIFRRESVHKDGALDRDGQVLLQALYRVRECMKQLSNLENRLRFGNLEVDAATRKIHGSLRLLGATRQNLKECLDLRGEELEVIE
ncbi:hypothetical protein BGZ75_002095 [Mortierella antarctica]|nr:hypothetical protein BGZ75_002095 [Mortierella antarctica]